MLQDVRISVFSRVTNSPHLYNWYRVGSESERKSGKHIVIEAILNETELNQRLRGTYGRN